MPMTAVILTTIATIATIGALVAGLFGAFGENAQLILATVMLAIPLLGLAGMAVIGVGYFVRWQLAPPVTTMNILAFTAFVLGCTIALAAGFSMPNSG